MNGKKRNIAKILLKILAITVAILLILIVGIRFSLKTAPVHNFVKNTVVKTANKQLNAKLSIDKITGDLWRDFKIHDISVSNPDTLIKVDSLHVVYNIYSLLSGIFVINNVELDGTYAKISEIDSSRFDILELVDADTTKKENESDFNFWFDIEKLAINNLQAYLFSPSLLPDSTLSIQNFDFNGGLAFLDSPKVRISKLDFEILEGRLPEPINISTKADFDGKNFNLQQFVLHTGRSFVESSASVDMDLNQITGKLATKPFSTKDALPYLEGDIPLENIEMELALSGSKNDLVATLNLASQSIRDLTVTANLAINPAPTLHALHIKSGGINIPDFETGEPLVSIHDLELTLDGEINNEFERAILGWDLAMNDIHTLEYRIKNVSSNGNLAGGNLAGAININAHTNEIIDINAQASSLFGDLPNWKITANGKQIDAGYWASNSDFVTNLDFKAQLNGTGFALSENNWNYDVVIGEEPFDIMGQSIQTVAINGKINQTQANLNSTLKLQESELTAKVELHDFLADNIHFNYLVETHNLNLSEINSLENLPTKLNIELTGNGSGNSMDNLAFSGTLKTENGYINAALLDKIEIDYALNNGMLVIDHGEFISALADVDLNVLFDINDFQNINNRVDFAMELKNLNPLAPLGSFQKFNITGDIAGNLDLSDEKQLQTNLKLNLTDIQIDSLLIANSVEGDIMATLAPELNYNLNFNIESPTISGVILQDVIFEVDGIVANAKVDGSYRLSVFGSDRGNVLQKGVYTADTEIKSLLLTVQQFDINALDSKLFMKQDFRVIIENSAIKTDTLHLVSDKKDTYLMVSVPVADSTQQKAWLKGNRFDFGIIQDVLLDERFVDGVLSGNADFEKTDTTISANASLSMEELNYQGFISDSIGIFLNIKNDKLIAETSITVDNKEIVTGNVNLPFAFASGEDLPDEFFDRPVQGELKINSTELSQLQALLDVFGIKNTSGIISFNGALTGSAGNPNFDGDLTLSRPVLSGVVLDSIYSGFRYHNKTKQIKIENLILAAKQKAAEITVDIPFEYNFRTFEPITTGEKDSVEISVLTDRFNLAVLNDFIDHKTATNLRGFLSGNLNVKSNFKDTEMKGEFKLDDAKINITAANIKLEDIRSKLTINENRITLDELRAKSGPGTFDASGFVRLNGLTPDTMSISAKANQFRLINTKDYNATIDLDSKISGTMLSPKITGKLAVKNGFVVLQSFGDKYIEDVQLESDAENVSLYDSLAIEMQLVIERNFHVRNKQYLDMEIEVVGDIDAVKEKNRDLELFGSLEGPKGYVKPLGKLFNLDEAQITFSGPVTDPDLHIKSSHKLKQNEDVVTLYYIIEGSANDPEFRFDSDPPMDQQDIIAYTIFGRPFYMLDSWQRTISGGSGNTTTASDVILNILLDEVEALAMQELGIDVVQIDNIRSGNETGTSVKAGWYVNNRTFFAVISEFGTSNPKTLYLLEYMLTKNTDLIITQGDNARQGVDIRWKYDY